MTDDEVKSLKRSYGNHKKMTKGRLDKNGNPIEFRLTFEQWLEIWLESGQAFNRGTKGGQYCMSRLGPDIGHYEVGNVVIQLTSQNSREAKLGTVASYRGRESPMKGRTQTREARDAISAARLAHEAKKRCPSGQSTSYMVYAR